MLIRLTDILFEGEKSELWIFVFKQPCKYSPMIAALRLFKAPVHLERLSIGPSCWGQLCRTRQDCRIEIFVSNNEFRELIEGVGIDDVNNQNEEASINIFNKMLDIDF